MVTASKTMAQRLEEKLNQSSVAEFIHYVEKNLLVQELLDNRHLFTKGNQRAIDDYTSCKVVTQSYMEVELNENADIAKELFGV